MPAFLSDPPRRGNAFWPEIGPRLTHAGCRRSPW